MEKKEMVLVAMIIAALAASRLIPHAPNFTSALAGLIFGGAVLRKGLYALLILAGYFLTDLIINNINYAGDHEGFMWISHSFYWVYSALILTYLISRMFTGPVINPFGLLAVSLGSSVLFFLLSNFGVWFENVLYLRNLQGLASCFTAALPFFVNESAGTIFFTCIFFSAYWIYGSTKFQRKRVQTGATV